MRDKPQLGPFVVTILFVIAGEGILQQLVKSSAWFDYSGVQAQDLVQDFAIKIIPDKWSQRIASICRKADRLAATCRSRVVLLGRQVRKLF